MTFDTVAIIGFGRFGRLLAEILAEDFDVVVHGRRAVEVPAVARYRAASLEEALAADAVFYAVPISSFEDVLRAHLPTLLARDRPPLLVDVLSVKLHPKRVFETLLPPHVEAILSHPMFGPDSVSALGLAGLPIVLDRFRASDESTTTGGGTSSASGSRSSNSPPTSTTASRPTARASRTSSAASSTRCRFTPTPIDTVGTRKLLEIREQTCNDTWELFTDLQTRNPYTLDMRVALGRRWTPSTAVCCRTASTQDRLVVGIQGGRGSFNEQAALYYLGREKIDRYDIRYLHTTARVLAGAPRRADRSRPVRHPQLGRWHRATSPWRRCSPTSSGSSRSSRSRSRTR